MKQTAKNLLLVVSKSRLRLKRYESFSMRSVSQKNSIVLTSIYHFLFKRNVKQNKYSQSPEKGYLHICNVLTRSIYSVMFKRSFEAIQANAQAVSRAVHGFLLEFYPATSSPSEIQAITNTLHSFLLNRLIKKEYGINGITKNKW